MPSDHEAPTVPLGTTRERQEQPTPLTAARVAAMLDADLPEWQRRWLDELLDPAHRDQHLEWRFVGRRVGYGWVWVPNDPSPSTECDENAV